MTFIEEARRAQLVEATIASVAEHGVARASLARIAGAAGVSKAAVLYHFDGKDTLLRAAHDRVLAALVAVVGRAVDDAAGPADAVDAYVTAMIDHLAGHPHHVRLLAEALGEPTTGIDAARRTRWGPLAELIDAAREAGEYRPDVDGRRLAVTLGGAIDGILTERLDDATFDTHAAANDLCAMVPRASPGSEANAPFASGPRA